MSTEVLLLDNVPSLGSEGDLVTVTDGYARNYLLPKDLAAPASAGTRRRLLKLQTQREAQRKDRLAEAGKLARQLSSVSVTIKARTSGSVRLYGSVAAPDIVTALLEQKIQIDAAMVQLEAPIKELGVYDIKLKLHDGIDATVKVWVVEE